MGPTNLANSNSTAEILQTLINREEEYKESLKGSICSAGFCTRFKKQTKIHNMFSGNNNQNLDPIKVDLCHHLERTFASGNLIRVIRNTDLQNLFDSSSTELCHFIGMRILRVLDEKDGSLDLSGSVIDDRSFNLLMTGLDYAFKNKLLQKLTSVNLSNCNVNDTRTSLLTNVLKGHCKLVELNLRDNEITSVGVEVLSNLFSVLSLRSLNLAENRVGDRGAQQLLDLLKYNTSLTELNLNHNFHAELRYLGATIEIRIIRDINNRLEINRNNKVQRQVTLFSKCEPSLRATGQTFNPLS